jgi:hypothetical protein
MQFKGLGGCSVLADLTSLGKFGQYAGQTKIGSVVVGVENDE